MGGLATILGSGAAGVAGAPGAGASAEAESARAAAERHGSVLQRHAGTDGGYLLPHRIDHVGNMRRLAEAGCDRVLAICSVGSVDPALPVGSFLCPDDFIALGGPSPSAFEDAQAHAVPGFDRAWRARVVAAWEAGRAEIPPLRDGGVYWQTAGPRFETPAEIRLIAAHADVVGMTMAGECVAAGAQSLAYAAVCVVDNLANGLAADQLSPAQIERDRIANATTLATALDTLLPTLL